MSMQKNILSKLSLMIISGLIISGCASIPKSQVDDKLASWQGSNIQTIIQAWGIPSRETEVNGIKYAEWDAREIKSRPSVNVGVGGFGGRFFGSIGTALFGGLSEKECRIQIGYNIDGTVVKSHWNGDSDTCDKAIPERSRNRK